MESEFTLTISADATQPISYTGSIAMSGEQFRLAFMDMNAAYDGNTLYMYQEDTDELTLSHPTEQELLETNPFLYAKALQEVCHITERVANNGQTIVTLTPHDQSIGIQRFTLTLTKDELPARIEIKEGKKTTTLVLRNAKYTDEQQTYILTPEKSTYVNDLR